MAYLEVQDFITFFNVKIYGEQPFVLVHLGLTAFFSVAA